MTWEEAPSHFGGSGPNWRGLTKLSNLTPEPDEEPQAGLEAANRA